MERVPPKKRRNETVPHRERDRSIVLDERAQVQPGNRETAQRAGTPAKRSDRRPARR
jgi:hypothetical protein